MEEVYEPVEKYAVVGETTVQMFDTLKEAQECYNDLDESNKEINALFAHKKVKIKSAENARASDYGIM